MKNCCRLVPLLFIVLFLASCGGGSGAVIVPLTGTASLAWTAPTTNDNGTTLTNLAGFKVHYGTSSGLYTGTIVISSPTATNYTATLPAGATYYFVVTAYNTSGVESLPSNEGKKTL
jgi:hypothetical protein